MSDQAVLELKDKLSRWMTDHLGPVQVDPQGDLTVRAGSARLFVQVSSLGNDSTDTSIRVFSPVLLDVPKTPEFLEWVARAMSEYRFGAFSVMDGSGPDLLDLYFEVSILGTFVDQEEFRTAYMIVGGMADDLDDELQEKFGGKRFHEDG